jgi:hypothetical protein
MAFAFKTALGIAGQTEKEISGVLRKDPAVAQKYLSELSTRHKSASELLLVIDQFEELFTQSKRDERQDFFKLLDHIVALPHVRIIITLRADFYAQAIEESRLAEWLRRNRTLQVTPKPLPSRIQPRRMTIWRPVSGIDRGFELDVPCWVC